MNGVLVSVDFMNGVLVSAGLYEWGVGEVGCDEWGVGVAGWLCGGAVGVMNGGEGGVCVGWGGDCRVVGVMGVAGGCRERVFGATMGWGLGRWSG